MLSLLVLVCQHQVAWSSSANLAGGRLSRDCSAYYVTYGGMARTVLATGANWNQAPLVLVLTKTPRLSAAAVGTGQGVPWPRVGDQTSFKSAPNNILDAIGDSRCLVSTPLTDLRKPYRTYDVVAEIRLDKKGKDANLCWLLPRESGGQGIVAGRFVSSSTVQVWTIQAAGRLVKYACGRGDGSVRKLQTLHVKVPGARWLWYEPVSSSSMVELQDFNFALANASGSILKRVERYPKPDRFPSVQATWELVVPNSGVEGGRNAWIPLSYSADFRCWLARNVETKSVQLLKVVPDFSGKA